MLLLALFLHQPGGLTGNIKTGWLNHLVLTFPVAHWHCKVKYFLGIAPQYHPLYVGVVSAIMEESNQTLVAIPRRGLQALRTCTFRVRRRAVLRFVNDLVERKSTKGKIILRWKEKVHLNRCKCETFTLFNHEHIQLSTLCTHGYIM